MTTRDKKTRNSPVDLACRMDVELRASGISGNLLDLNNGRELLQDSISDFSEDERRELKAAKAALYFLNRVRVDLDNVSNQHDSSIRLAGGRDSTVNNLETQPAHSGAKFEFTNLGRFEIIEPIGQGGFAKVYLARDPQLDRKVAIKVLQTHALLSDESRSRFEREARAAAVLSHPAILPIFETGNVGPITFIVTEYCPGSTLAHWFSDLDSTTDLRTAAEIVEHLAEAAQHAHQRGIIHRDLKPANVLIQHCEKPISQRLRIADFGLAKQIECSDMTITTDGAVVGTPAYMSPEQARGAAEIDGSTDIFSLGVILYELLTGKLPFQGSGHLSTLNAIANETPVAPRRIKSAIPKDLEAICLKCLNKRPEDRYPDAFSLADDLNAWLSGRQVAARHATRGERLVRWVGREPALAAALAMAFFSLALGLVLTAWQWQAAQANLVDSNVQRDRALKNIHRIQATVQNILDEYGTSPSDRLFLDPAHRNIISEMMRIHKELIDEEAQALNVTKSTINSYARIAQLNMKLGQYERVQEICQQARTLAELAIKNNPDDEAQFRSTLVEISVQEICLALNFGRNEQAEQLARDALADMQKFPSQQPAAQAQHRWFTLYRHLGWALHAQEKFADMVPCMERSMKHAASLLATHPTKESFQSDYGISLQDVATAYRLVGRKAQATMFFEKALVHFQEMTSKDSSKRDYRERIGYLQLDLAESYASENRIEEAGWQFSAATSVLEELVADHPSDIGAYNRLVHTIVREALFRETTSEFEKARALHERGLEMADKVAFDLMRTRYQLMLRVGYSSLLIDHLAEDDDAWVNDTRIEELLDQAIDRGEAAMLAFPRENSVAEQLAEAYRYKGRMLYARKQFEQAYQLFVQASQVAVRQLCMRPDLRSAQELAIIRAQYAAKLAAELDHYRDAKLILIQLADASPNAVAVQFQSARYLSRLLGSLKRGGHSPDEIDEVESIALQKLAKAFELGFVNQGQFEQQAEWQSIGDSVSFKKLVESN